MAAVRDLSDTLDILGAQPSDVLGRGPDRWEALHATQAGQALISGAPGQAPAWQTISGGGGLWQQIEDVTLAVGLAINVYRDVVVPPNAQELEWTLWQPAPGTLNRPMLRVNASNAAVYHWGGYGLTNTGAFSQGRLANDTAIRLSYLTTLNAAWRMVYRGRVFQPTTASAVAIFSEMQAAGLVTTTLSGLYDPAAPVGLSSIGFGSSIGVGLPAGTRIIVRAAIP